MAKTQQQYEDAYYSAGKKRIDEQYGVRQTTDAATLAKINQSIDTAAQTAAGQYQQRIDEAPALFQEQYDANHMNELINRKKVQESMANMGLTDSGLNRSQQTALSVQRGNADGATRQQQQDYVTAATQAIDQILAEAEGQKAEQAASISKATDDWYTGVLAQLASDSQTAAATSYAADQEYAAQVEAARIQAEQARIQAEQDAQAERLKWAQSMMENMGYDENTALASGYGVYPTEDEVANTYYAAYSNARKAGYDDTYAQVYATAAAAGEDPTDAVESTMIQRASAVVGKEDLMQGKGNDWMLALFKTGADNAKYVVEELGRQLEENRDYAQLDPATKEYALATAAGNTINHRWGGGIGEYSEHEKRIFIEGLQDKFTGTVLAAALSAAGLA